jgi:aryl-alcohol dehydrogenase-like predicted oxidoreductase
MEKRALGQSGWSPSSLGLGCMGMSDFYCGRDDAESVATIQAALDAGITLLDSGDFYGMGHNELLIREALKGRQRDRVSLSQLSSEHSAIGAATSLALMDVPCS